MDAAKIKAKANQSTLVFGEKRDGEVKVETTKMMKESVKIGERQDSIKSITEITEDQGSGPLSSSKGLMDKKNSRTQMRSSHEQRRANDIEKRDRSHSSDSDDEGPIVKRRRKSSEHLNNASSKTSTPLSASTPEMGVHTRTKRESPLRNDNSSSEVEAEEEEGADDSAIDEVKDRPKKAVQKHEKIQATLSSTGNESYPDWKAGDPVPYAALCKTFSFIEMTTKRLEISAQCSAFLQQVLRLTPQDLLPTVQLMINKVAADYAGIELGIGESLILKAISETTGRTLGECKADHHKIGDLGLVAAKSRSNQRTMFKPKPLTVRSVHQGLLTIASLQGHGAQERKVNGIMKLLSAADASAATTKGQKSIDISKDKGGPSESKFLIRFLEGKLRLGLAEKTVIVAVAQAAVKHEAAQKGDKPPSSEKMAQGEAILKSVYR